jgi:hypothetical protein
MLTTPSKFSKLMVHPIMHVLLPQDKSNTLKVIRLLKTLTQHKVGKDKLINGVKKKSHIGLGSPTR